MKQLTKIKQYLIRLNWFMTTQIGLDVRLFLLSIIRVPAFLFDYFSFISRFQGLEKIYLQPCLHDRFDRAGDVDNEYFWQDLLVAQRVMDMDSEISHCDVGSRIDGFVAHVASVRKVTVSDIRPITVKIPNVHFIRNDLLDSKVENKFDLVTCLHTIEHIGLGRYGDAIGFDGWKIGLASLAKMVKSNGVLIVTCPIGKPAIRFNANYVISPMDVLGCAESLNLRVVKIRFLKNHQFTDVHQDTETFDVLCSSEYNLGYFEFTKLESGV
jgi:hypothetical protein